MSFWREQHSCEFRVSGPNTFHRPVARKGNDSVRSRLRPALFNFSKSSISYRPIFRKQSSCLSNDRFWQSEFEINAT